MKFYTAGKIWHADKFRFLRDTVGLTVHARWIDLASDSNLVVNRKGELWQQCYEDVRDSNFVLVYCEDQNEILQGALVEIGMAYGLNKAVYCVGKCKSLVASDNSDVAFTQHHLWTWLDTDNLIKGAYYALGLQLARGLKKKAA